MSINRDEISQQLKQFETNPRNLMVRATVPFYGLKGEQLFKDRTGVFLQIADEYFILTASHYLRDFIKEKTILAIGHDRETKAPIPLIHSTFHSTDDETIDVALIKLDTEAALKLKQVSVPISLGDIDYQISRRPGIFAICGFPQEWFVIHQDGLFNTGFVYMTDFYNGELNPFTKYDEQHHYLFTLNDHYVKNPDTENEMPSAAGMPGISGCGIWRLCDGTKVPSEWNCKLIAIQHSYDGKRGYVVATHIHHVLGRLFQQYPHLQNALKLIHYPQ